MITWLIAIELSRLKNVNILDKVPAFEDSVQVIAGLSLKEMSNTGKLRFSFLLSNEFRTPSNIAKLLQCELRGNVLFRTKTQARLIVQQNRDQRIKQMSLAFANPAFASCLGDIDLNTIHRRISADTIFTENFYNPPRKTEQELESHRAVSQDTPASIVAANFTHYVGENYLAELTPLSFQSFSDIPAHSEQELSPGFNFNFKSFLEKDNLWITARPQELSTYEAWSNSHFNTNLNPFEKQRKPLAKMSSHYELDFVSYWDHVTSMMRCFDDQGNLVDSGGVPFKLDTIAFSSPSELKGKVILPMPFSMIANYVLFSQMPIGTPDIRREQTQEETSALLLQQGQNGVSENLYGSAIRTLAKQLGDTEFNCIFGDDLVNIISDVYDPWKKLIRSDIFWARLSQDYYLSSNNGVFSAYPKSYIKAEAFATPRSSISDLNKAFSKRNLINVKLLLNSLLAQSCESLMYGQFGVYVSLRQPRPDDVDKLLGVTSIGTKELLELYLAGAIEKDGKILGIENSVSQDLNLSLPETSKILMQLLANYYSDNAINAADFSLGMFFPPQSENFLKASASNSVENVTYAVFDHDTKAKVPTDDATELELRVFAREINHASIINLSPRYFAKPIYVIKGQIQGSNGTVLNFNLRFPFGKSQELSEFKLPESLLTKLKPFLVIP